MRLLIKTVTIMLSIMFATVIVAFAGCGEPAEIEENGDSVVVTFDLNYDGAADQQISVLVGEKVAKPEDPTRDGYTFDGWYIDEELSALYNFDSLVESNITIYAGWLDESLVYHTVTFNLCYEEGENFTRKVADGERLGTVADPERDGYSFFGWYIDEELTTQFSQSTKLTSDVTLYARWGKNYVFEAEHTYLRDKVGPSSSGEGSYLDMIFVDSKNLGASNGYAVTYLYAKDGTINKYKTTLTFYIESDKDVDDAILYLRMTAEIAAITINGDEYQVIVNGVVYNYEDISLDIVDRNTPCPFEDYLISKKVSLNEGTNIIQLKVNNNDSAIGGTTYSKAPVVDCIKISTDANIAWGTDEENGIEYPILNEELLIF